MSLSHLDENSSKKAQSLVVQDNGTYCTYWSKPWIITGLALVLLGTILRLWSYSSALPFRHDEIWLALNIVERSYSGLIEPLKYNQSAPIGFLFASKLIVDLAGEHELAYRLLPMFCSVAGLWLFWLIIRRFHHAAGAVVALAAVSLSPSLIKYAGDFKQYSSEFATVSAMLLVALPWFTGSRSLGRWIALTCVGSLCLYLSVSSVFCVGAVGSIWLVELIVKKDKEGIIKLLATALIWMFFLATAYWFNLRHSAGNTQLQLYWLKSKGYMPTDSVLSSIQWVVNSFLEIPKTLAFGLNPTVLAAVSILALVGQVSLLIKKRATGILMLLFTIMPLFAAIFQKYPFKGRLVIFLLPVFLFLLGEGVNRIVTSQSWPRVVLVATCIIYLLPVSLQRFEGPIGVGERFDMPGVIKYLNAHISKNELVIIPHFLHYNFDYYKLRLNPTFNSTIMHLPWLEDLSPESARSSIMKEVHKAGLVKGLWVVVPNHRLGQPGQYDRPVSAVKTALVNFGHIKDVVKFHNITMFYITNINIK